MPAPPAALDSETLLLIEQQKAPLAMFMSEASFYAADEPVVAGRAKYVIELDPIAATQVEKNKKLIEGALSEVSGGPCLVELRKVSRAATPQKKADDGVATGPKGGHVKKAMGVFKARIVARGDAS